MTSGPEDTEPAFVMRETGHAERQTELRPLNLAVHFNPPRWPGTAH